MLLIIHIAVLFIRPIIHQHSLHSIRYKIEPYNSISMNAKHISSVNEAILVLRHFIDLSARLLPFLEELEQKQRPTVRDLVSKQKIIEVYSSYDFDTNTSKLLMNSNALELIKKSFETICSRETKHGRRGKCTPLRQFLLEHNRLQQNWWRIEAN